MSEDLSEDTRECDCCGEGYDGEETIQRWLTQTDIINAKGEEEGVTHCRHCDPCGRKLYDD
jgi:hypothetical protein|tara:strand:- start:177 stop:359 length:183 start_codon:yes stop_codon:yes gene_type:complete